MPAVLEEARAPTLTVEEASEVLARVLAHEIPDAGDHRLVRELAGLAPGLDYPGGPIGQAYGLSEYIDCECHAESLERAEAASFEARLRATPPLRVDAGLAAALGHQ